MMNALKCDRCKNYFDYDPSAKYNFIAFGHKDIIVGKNFPVKDICPGCMKEFMDWFEAPKKERTDPAYMDMTYKDFNDLVIKEVPSSRQYIKEEE